jgi:hypothetical protein
VKGKTMSRSSMDKLEHQIALPFRNCFRNKSNI